MANHHPAKFGCHRHCDGAYVLVDEKQDSTYPR